MNSVAITFEAAISASFCLRVFCFISFTLSLHFSDFVLSFKHQLNRHPSLCHEPSCAFFRWWLCCKLSSFFFFCSSFLLTYHDLFLPDIYFSLCTKNKVKTKIHLYIYMEVSADNRLSTAKNANCQQRKRKVYNRIKN